MSIEERFDEAMKNWAEYYSRVGFIHFNPKFIINCQGYRDIVAMGVAALPLLRATSQIAFYSESY